MVDQAEKLHMEGFSLPLTLKILLTFFTITQLLASISSANNDESSLETNINISNFEKLLDQNELITIEKQQRNIATTGGPIIPLPNGKTVSRDTILIVLKKHIDGVNIDPFSLLDSLKNEKVHVRYGALMALKLVTNASLEYYPFLLPIHPDNKDAYKQWEQHLKDNFR